MLSLFFVFRSCYLFVESSCSLFVDSYRLRSSFLDDLFSIVYFARIFLDYLRNRIALVFFYYS